ncbi:MAG: hypothetical protein ABR985_22060 [Methanotrichaceae archaeon]
MHAKIALIEEPYIDKDYLIDYSGYYARSFSKISKCTTRLHFFSNSFSQENFDELLTEYAKNNEIIKPFKEGYLGFVVIKPVMDKANMPLIGRTILNHLPKADGSEVREYLWSINESNIYGLPFQVETLPFQAQDQAVSACATISLWTANNIVNKIFQTPPLSPIEITKRAINAIEELRSFPSSGLTIKQMFAFFRSIDLECEYINILNMHNIVESNKWSAPARDKIKEKLKRIIPDTIRALTSAKIPIIAPIYIKKNNNKLIDREDYHTVLISGYKHDVRGKISKIYVHDDQIGPYCKVKDKSGDGSFQKWEYDWITEFGYDEIGLHGLLIPLYPKIRLNYSEIYETLLKLRKDFPSYDLQLHLMTIHDYKREILLNNPKDKIKLLKKSMPRFMWVIRNVKDNAVIWDYLFDATFHNVTKIADVFYK